MKSLFFIFSFGILTHSLCSQSAQVKEREYLIQLEDLHSGTILFIVSDTVESSGLRNVGNAQSLKEIERKENELALMNAFEEFYQFSTVVFCLSLEDGLNKLKKDLNDPDFESEKFFLGKIQKNSDNTEGCSIVKSGESINSGKSKSENDTYFDLMMDAYDTGSFDDGGIVINRLLELRKKHSRKKDLVVNFHYNVRLHKSLLPEERFREAVKFLQKKLQSELIEYRKRQEAVLK